MKKATASQIEELRNLTKKSLYVVCTQFLGFEDWDVVHDDVEKLMMRPSRQKALLLPRGHLKSSIVTVGYVIRRILENPNIRVLIANQVWDMARKFLGEIKGHLEGSKLKYLHGDFVSNKWNSDEIVVRQRTRSLKEPTVLTTGVEAETTGGHFDLIVLDDLTGLQNSQTLEQREKTKRFRRSMINLLEPGGDLVEIGTRWHLDDTFSVIFEQEMMYYDVMVRRVVEDGKIIFPKHFSKRFDRARKSWVSVPGENCMDYIEHLKAKMPMDEFAAQYLNDPIPVENASFRAEMFKYFDRRPEGMSLGMAVDLAISERVGADYTAIVVMGRKGEDVYVLDYLRGRWGPSEIVQNIFQKQMQWRPHAVGMEVNGFQRTLKLGVESEMRKRGHYFGIEEIRSGPERSKESRIKSLEPFYRGGLVWHAPWMKKKDLEVELLTFPKGKHDDLIDAEAMCLPLLGRGAGEVAPKVPEGSWEWAWRSAMRHSMPGGDFFGMRGRI